MFLSACTRHSSPVSRQLINESVLFFSCDCASDVVCVVLPVEPVDIVEVVDAFEEPNDVSTDALYSKLVISRKVTLASLLLVVVVLLLMAL